MGFYSVILKTFSIAALTCLLFGCNDIPEEEIERITNTLSLAKQEDVNYIFSYEFNTLVDSINLVFEHIEGQKSKLLLKDFKPCTEQLIKLDIQLNNLRRKNKELKETEDL